MVEFFLGTALLLLTGGMVYVGMRDTAPERPSLDGLISPCKKYVYRGGRWVPRNPQK